MNVKNVLYHCSTLILCTNHKNGDDFQGIGSRRYWAVVCHDKIIFIWVFFMNSLFHMLRHIFQDT